MEWEIIIPEVFLLIILVELASRRGKSVDMRTKGGKKEVENMVDEFTQDMLDVEEKK